jgi:chaperonin GroES
MIEPGAKKGRIDFDIIEPVGWRVLVRKDDNRRETKSGIVLPGNHEILTLTGRVIAISKMVENDPDTSLRQYDKILFDPREAIPVEFDPDNRLFVVPLEKILAIFRKSSASSPAPTQAAPESDTDTDLPSPD